MNDARLWGEIADATLERMGASQGADRLRARLEERMADLEHRGGRLPEAEAHGRRALALWERLDPESHNVSTSLSILGGVVNERGRSDEAEALARRDIALLQKLKAPPYDQAMAYKQLASAEMDQHHMEAALADMELGVELARAAHGPGSMLVAAILNNRAIAKSKLKRYDEAASDYGEARAIYTEHLGALSPKVAMTLENEARIYLMQKRFPEARVRLTEALSVDEQSLGVDHLDLVLVLQKLAWLEAVQKRFAEAAQYADRAVAIAEKRDPQGKLAATSLNYAGFAHSDKPREAVPLYRRAAVAYERVFGARSTDLATVLVELGMLEIELGEPDAARASLERAQGISDAALDPGQRLALGRLCAQAGERDRARTFLAQARDRFREAGDKRQAAEAETWLARATPRPPR
jgi:tetratricopeptide (TPR) repeat protein